VKKIKPFNDRSWYGTVPAAGHAPDLFSGAQIVAPHVLPAVDEQLRPRPLRQYIRRAPGRGVIAPRAPDFFAVGDVKGGDKSVREYVALHEDEIAVNDRGTGESPFQCDALGIRNVVVNDWAGSQYSKIFLPAEASLQIVAKQPFGSEERNHVLPVGCHRAISMRGLGMAFQLRPACVRGFFPKNLSGPLVQTKDSPLLDVIIVC
jgi:hypothetical protein